MAVTQISYKAFLDEIKDPVDLMLAMEDFVDDNLKKKLDMWLDLLDKLNKLFSDASKKYSKKKLEMDPDAYKNLDTMHATLREIGDEVEDLGKCLLKCWNNAEQKIGNKVKDLDLNNVKRILDM